MFVFPPHHGFRDWSHTLLEMDGSMRQKEMDAKCNPEVCQSLKRAGQDFLRGSVSGIFSEPVVVHHGVDTFTQRTDQGRRFG